MVATYSDHVGVYGNYYLDDKQASRMEVSHTQDGYWVLSCYISPEHNDVQTSMAEAKERFIKANPLIEPAKWSLLMVSSSNLLIRV